MSDEPTRDPVHPEAVNYAEAARSGDEHPEPQPGWEWRDPTHGEHFRRCGWCGSIHPEDLAAEDGFRAEWADRKYGWPHKFYVDVANRTPDRLYVLGSIHGGPPDRPLDAGYLPWDTDWTAEQQAAIEDYRFGSPPRGVRFDTRTVHHAKFYSAHLADPAISQEAKDTIHYRSGLVFTFEDGKVRWRNYDYEGCGR